MLVVAAIIFGVIIWRRRRNASINAGAAPQTMGFEVNTADAFDDDDF